MDGHSSIILLKAFMGRREDGNDGVVNHVTEKSHVKGGAPRDYILTFFDIY